MTARILALFGVVLVASWAVAQPSAKAKPDGQAPEAGKPVAAFGGHAAEILALAFNADGKQVVSVSAKDLRFWPA